MKQFVRVTYAGSVAIVCSATLSLLMGIGELNAQMFIDQSSALGVTGVITAHEWGSGLSCYDFDQDNKDDLSFCSNNGPMLFYTNSEEGFSLTSLDITAAGITKQVIWVDFNEDDLLDAMVTSLTGRVYLYKNMGNDNFADITASAGLPMATAFNTGISFADYDRDGDLDLYLCRYVLVDFDPNNGNQYNKLYRNNGDETFTDVTTSSGISTPPTLAFQGVWLDYDKNQWPDLFVIVDRDPSNVFFKNNGDGTFEEVTSQVNMSYTGMDIMSNTVADFNHDGYSDVFMTNTGASYGLEQTPSKLAVNVNGLFFSESGPEYGLEIFDFGWGAQWIDADNDGWLDLYFATPGSTDENHFFLSDSGTYFISANDSVSVPTQKPSFGVAKGDFDQNGYDDLAVQSRAPNHPYILMNQGSGANYIKLTPHGTVSNGMAVGTWLHVYSGGTTYAHYTLCGEAYHAQNSQHLSFGLGEADAVDSLHVAYPSGHTDVYYDLEVNTHYHLQEGETYAVQIQAPDGYEVCAGDSVNLDAGEHYSYLWSTGDTSRYITVASSGMYTVSTTNAFGFTAADSLQVVVNPNPSITAVTTPVNCYGYSNGSIQLVNQTGVAPDSVWWDTGAVGDSLVNLMAGSYSYSYLDVNGCFSSGSVQLLQPDSIVLVASSTASTAGSANGSITALAFGGSPPFTLLINGDTTSTTTSGLVSGGYEFVAIDARGCSDTLWVTVDEVVSTVDAGGTDVQVYPVPARDKVRVTLPGEAYTLALYDMRGGLLLTTSSRGSTELIVTHLPAGVYLLGITSEGERTDYRRVEVIH